MNRTLRRPMFRIGGVAEGITSGLAPRQGYATGLSDALRKRKISDVLSGATTLGEAEDLSRAMAYKPRGTNVYDFMTEFGLDIASRPPVKGGILATAATSAKDPYARFMQRKGEADVQRYASESDMFKTLIEGAATATGEGGDKWQKQWELQQIGSLMDEISGYKDIPLEKRTKEQNQALAKAEEKLAKIKTKDLAVEWFLGTGADVGADKLFKKIKTDLLLEDDKTGSKKYAGNEENPDLIADTFVAFKKYIAELKADGGRVGHQLGGEVMPEQPIQAKSTGGYDTSGLQGYDMEGGFQPSNLPGFSAQESEDTAGISYEELRARLPQEVGDDIVRLLANSAEALEDFAMIQTEQDINTFNKKYGVNLVLPSEG